MRVTLIFDTIGQMEWLVTRATDGFVFSERWILSRKYWNKLDYGCFLIESHSSGD